MLEHTYSLSFGKLAAKVWGPENGRPIIALHGWLDNAASFDKIAPLLPDFRIVAVDLPGHGDSFHLPPGLNYHLVDSLTYVPELLARLGWNRATFLGHSLGGGILSLLAGAAPSLVDKLILIEAIGPHSNLPEEMPGRIGQAIEESSKLKGKKKPVYPDAETAAIARQKAGGLSLEASRVLVSRGLAKTEGGWTWKSDARLRLPSLQRLTEEEVLAFLRKIECSTLLVEGKSGFLNADAIRVGVENRKRAIRNFKSVVLEGNHHLHLDIPEQVAKVILEFLA